MSNLTYSIIYTPDKKSNTQGINYVCSDKKIHVRFRDFDSPQLITGFEKKLTYLMCYLMNYSYIVNLFKFCDSKILINALLESPDVKKIYEALRYSKKIEFKAFRLSLNYKKKGEEVMAFGKLEQEAFPLEYDEFGALKEATLETFLNKLKINLLEYLFNDSYSILIHKKEAEDVNAKFINKEERKNNKSELENDFIKLW